MSSKVFKVFPSYDKIETNTEVGVKITIKGEGKIRFLDFSEPVRSIELNNYETLKIAFALLGRIAICENCGNPFRRKASVGIRAKARFCSRECWKEAFKKNPEEMMPQYAKAQKTMFLAFHHPEQLDGKPNFIDLTNLK